jgi:hypothetical protein
MNNAMLEMPRIDAICSAHLHANTSYFDYAFMLALILFAIIGFVTVLNYTLFPLADKLLDRAFEWSARRKAE